MAIIEWLGFGAAFLAPMPGWREPSSEPVRWPLSGVTTSVVVGFGVLTLALPVIIAWDAYRSESAFREQCRASGGRVSLTRDALLPYHCSDP